MSVELAELLSKAEDAIFPYSEQYADAHTTFAKKMWPQKRRRRDPLYNRWKFRGPVQGNVDGLLLAVLDGQVVGQLGLIPVKLSVDGVQYDAQWACDLMVDSSIRRQRLGSLLLAVGMARPLVTLGSNPSLLADAAMSKLGFRPLAGPRYMILPLRPERDIRLRVPNRLHIFAPFLAFLFKPYLLWRARKLFGHQPGENIQVGSWREAAGFVYQQKIDFPHIVHDEAFMRWRCSGFQNFSPGLKSIKTGRGSFAIFEDTPTVFLVYEWRVSSFEETEILFRNLVRLATERHSQTISMLANSSQEQQWLARLGFFTTRTPYKVIYYPHEPLLKHHYFHYCQYDSDENL